MRRTLAVLVVIACASLFPKPTEALPCGREVDRVFYYNCGPGTHAVVGEIFTDCDGNVSSWGVTSDFEERTITGCCTGTARTTYWECGIQVTSLNTCIC